MSTASRKTRNRKTRLSLTELGAKVVPAVLLQTFDLDGDGAADDVRITGDAGNNKVVFTDNGATSATVQIDANGDGDVTDAADKAQTVNYSGDSFVVEANLGGGNDSFDYSVTAAFSASARSVTVDLGAGNDHFGWSTATFGLSKSRVALDVIAGAGNDTGEIAFGGEATGSAISVRTDWGAGRDDYTLELTEIDIESAADVVTDLGGGTNTHEATIGGVGKNDVATLDMAVIGGSKADTVVVHMTDDIGLGGGKVSRACVTAELGAGDDSFAVGFEQGDFLVDDLSQMIVSVRGGVGNDTLTARMDQGPSASPARLEPGAILAINLDGGAGKDTITTQFGVPNTWQFKTGGLMQLRLDGGTGDDYVAGLLANTADSIANYDVALRGGTGADTALFGLSNPGGTLSFGPAGGVILDGGPGLDVLTDQTPGFALKTGFETVK
jgi:hypothetical protein